MGVIIPFNEKETLEKLEADEKEARAFAVQLWSAPSTIARSEEYAKAYLIADDTTPDKKTFTSSASRFMYIFLGLLFIVMAIAISTLPSVKGGPLLVLFFIITIVISFYHALNTRKNLTIHLSEESFSVDKSVYKWSVIHAIYIIRRPNGKSNKWFIALVLDVGTIDKYEVTSLLLTPNKLAAYIEHYRRRGIMNTLDHK